MVDLFLLKQLTMRTISLVLFSIIWMSCSTDSKNRSEEAKYEQSKESIESIEQKKPARFLKATIKKKKNLLGQTVLRGTVHNSATVVTYKDVEIKLRFYSKTGALLEEDTDKVYESVAPGRETDFKLKYFAPKDTDSVSVIVMGASVASQ